MFNSIVHNVKKASIMSAKVAVGATGGLVGGTAGLVAGVAVGAVMGTAAGTKAGVQMALGMVWPAEHEAGNHEAGELVKTTATDIRGEIVQIEKEMRDLAGPAGKPKRGRGRPRKSSVATIDIDIDSMDSQELRDYMAGKTHLRPDPIF